MNHKFHVRWRPEPVSSVSPSAVTLPHNYPEYTSPLSGYQRNTKHFLERKQKTKHRAERGMRQGFALPCCSRHICRGAPQSEPSCVCSGWRIEKSSSHTQSTGDEKRNKVKKKAFNCIVKIKD